MTNTQKKAVSHFLDQVYALTGFYLLKCLGKEDQLVFNLSQIHTNQLLNKLREEILDELHMFLSDLKDVPMLQPPIEDFIKYHKNQKNSNGVYGLLEINDTLFPALSADGYRRYGKNRFFTATLGRIAR